VGRGLNPKPANTYQPSACQEIDLLRPVWVMARSVNRVAVAFSLQSGLRFQFWSRVDDAVPTPIEARTSRGEVREPTVTLAA